MPQVTANTGANDPNSIWGSGLLTTVETLGGTAANIIGALNGRQTTIAQLQTQQPVIQATAANSTPAWLPIVIIGSIVALVGFLLLKKS